jgi:hypothetical protein
MKFFASLAISGLIASASAAAIEKRTPPNIPSTSSAKTMLAGLATRTTDATGYDRLVPSASKLCNH